MNMKTGAWILSLVALAALVTIVLAEGAPAVPGLLSAPQPVAALLLWA